MPRKVLKGVARKIISRKTTPPSSDDCDSPSPPSPPSPPVPASIVSDNNESDGGAITVISKRKKRIQALVLTEDQEQGLSEWLKVNTFIYNKKVKQFRDSKRKLIFWDEKAAELGVDAPGLKTWYDSIRTKVGKITVMKSGSAVRELTERDQFLMDNFSFLKDHISRVPSRQGVSVSISHITICVIKMLYNRNIFIKLLYHF